jgi:hypothetical protein
LSQNPFDLTENQEFSIDPSLISSGGGAPYDAGEGISISIP